MNQMRICVSTSSIAAAWGLGRRTLTTASKALTGLGNRKVGKNSKASSELCKFLGIPDQSRTETALLISKFIKLNNFRGLVRASQTVSDGTMTASFLQAWFEKVMGDGSKVVSSPPNMEASLLFPPREIETNITRVRRIFQQGDSCSVGKACADYEAKFLVAAIIPRQS